MTALWIHEAADQFWSDAGGVPAGFPRDLGDVVSWALPVAPVALPNLSVARIDAWLGERGRTLRLDLPDRRLRACIVVFEGTGTIFLDAADDEDERRFSLAHEIAHYLVECHLPRKRARAGLGDEIVPVLDGRRAPSQEERIGALLGGYALGARLHLMERTPDGHLPGREVSAAERAADALAFELLAPVDVVRAHLPPPGDPQRLETALCQSFGLPPLPAAAYARELAPEPPRDSLFRRLFSVS